MIAGKTENEVIRAFGGDPETSRLMTFAETSDESAAHLNEDYELLSVVTVDRHVIAIEGGYYGCIPEIARRASADGGEFFSVYRDVNARYQVMHAVDGHVDGVFDPFDLEDAAWMDPAPEVPAWAEGVAFHMGALSAESFALMERTMGVAVDPGWWTRHFVLCCRPHPLSSSGGRRRHGCHAHIPRPDERRDGRGRDRAVRGEPALTGTDSHRKKGHVADYQAPGLRAAANHWGMVVQPHTVPRSVEAAPCHTRAGCGTADS